VGDSDLVKLLANKDTRLSAIRGLTGGITASELRQATVSDSAFAALVAGLNDPNPQVRWWCIQLLDHVPDVRAMSAIAAALADDVPRVRRNAAHALGCLACKPSARLGLPTEISDTLNKLAREDPNAKVRTEAHLALVRRKDVGL
jgi:HEAT repeat protein